MTVLQSKAGISLPIDTSNHFCLVGVITQGQLQQRYDRTANSLKYFSELEPKVFNRLRWKTHSCSCSTAVIHHFNDRENNRVETRGRPSVAHQFEKCKLTSISFINRHVIDSDTWSVVMILPWFQLDRSCNYTCVPINPGLDPKIVLCRVTRWNRCWQHAVYLSLMVAVLFKSGRWFRRCQRNSPE